MLIDTSMFTEQRALFQGAFDAQAANLAGTVGSATVASEVTASRFIVDETQTAAGYTEAIEPLPNCATGTNTATCEAITGCAFVSSTCTPLVVACPAAIPTGNHHAGGHTGHQNACNVVHSQTVSTNAILTATGFPRDASDSLLVCSRRLAPWAEGLGARTRWMRPLATRRAHTVCTPASCLLLAICCLPSAACCLLLAIVCLLSALLAAPYLLLVLLALV